jgi:hypothetical protein
VVSNIWKRIHRVSRVSVWLFAAVAFAQTPTLTLDKHFFFANESVRFWIGVAASDPIPEEVRESGVVHIVRPDGSKVDQPTSSPRDGDPSLSYKGGWGLGPGPHPIGTYRISFEYAGKTTEPQNLEIVANPFEGRVQAFWIFADTKSGGSVHTRGAILRVENHSDRTVRFAEPGLAGSEVSITVRQERPRLRDQRFVPESALVPPHIIPAYSLNNLDWKNLSRWPMVNVAPGQAAERTVALAAAFPFLDNVEYDVTIGLTLTLFIGEAGDPEARLFPERRIVSGDSRFRR